MNYAILITHPDYTECAVFEYFDSAELYWNKEERCEETRMVIVKPIVGRPFGIGNHGEVYGAETLKDSLDNPHSLNLN